ncbi:argininosuccinate lyase [Natranaerofaba carboxydovora]|uniref:argininosuccinate lyase n=1 Tax=Natranaerofaba carboxydovora TaxID=2742683 RepID=UPI001F1354CD|nr:argininosuccinate lyase [Natranaerofaba carboxydovora]UMZ74564.1 Argininosuccinate lyase [Natranaerofaba carboxydovora]
MKLWGGRFTGETDKLVEKFNASIDFDKKLALYDIIGSRAHVKMLAEREIITSDDRDKILKGLLQVESEIKEGKFSYKVEHEDIHMNIEARLIEIIGDVAKKIHTARSRNDQVALDLHLYARDRLVGMIELLIELEKAVLDLADEHKLTVMPGYTHLQRAQPISLGHHLMSYYGMLSRDVERLFDLYKRVDIMPLGACALAGTSYPIDRESVRDELQFERLYENSMDAVSDRDFVLEFLFCMSTIMTHLSRFSEDIILWSSSEYGFIELDDSFCTGSSIMPQKKNPDVAELIRGKVGRVLGSLNGLFVTLKALPLAYNKDMQEDKEGFFDAVETLMVSITLFTGMLPGIKVNEEKMKEAVYSDFSNATDLADYMVKKGISFRDAHALVGKAVLYCQENNKLLSELTLEELKDISPVLDEKAFYYLDPKDSVQQKKSRGGPAETEVMRQIEVARKEVLSQEATCEKLVKLI